MPGASMYLMMYLAAQSGDFSSSRSLTIFSSSVGTCGLDCDLVLGRKLA